MCIRDSSQSGAAADALEVVKAGNACGCTTVAITNFPDSVVAKEAKFHLLSLIHI